MLKYLSTTEIFLPCLRFWHYIGSRYTKYMMRVLNFGKYVKIIRGNISQKDFASHIGISQNHLSNLENGNREPTIPILIMLAEKKGVDISYWFSSEEDGIFCSKTSEVKISDDPSDVIIAFSKLRKILENNNYACSDKTILCELLAACERALHSSAE